MARGLWTTTRMAMHLGHSRNWVSSMIAKGLLRARRNRFRAWVIEDKEARRFIAEFRKGNIVVGQYNPSKGEQYDTRCIHGGDCHSPGMSCSMCERKVPGEDRPLLASSMAGFDSVQTLDVSKK